MYGNSAAGAVLYGCLQAATALILILAANTSFTGFPFLVSFVAEDSFLPRPLTVRGHRLVFSNGIIVLAIASIALLLVTRARVSSLIPLYAIGVFTGFTMAGLGMTRHHLTHKEPGWQRRRRDKRHRGRGVPVGGAYFRHYGVHPRGLGGRGGHADPHLRAGKDQRPVPGGRRHPRRGCRPEACEAPVLRRHTAIVLVDRIDLATARAIQYARNLTPEELYAVHFNVDNRRAEAVMRRWQDLGLSTLPLEVIEVADRRLGGPPSRWPTKPPATGRRK